MGVAGSASAAGIGEERFQPSVTYDLSVTHAERDTIHAEVEALAGRVSNARAGDGTYDPLTLVGAMLNGSSYDSISRGGTAATAYPFPVSNTAANQNEYDRKVAKLAWVVKLATDLGFPVVVQRQPDKYVYAEIGDPEAPEMVMALSHLDSPTASVSAAQLARWRDPFGNLGTAGAYHSPYIKDGWIYGAGMQDDSGPTLATLLAAKALLEAGLPLDRRIRIVMGIYEDGGPGTPSTTNTATFQSIPYNANPSFYDNWAYKNLNREEIPIAAYTSDSRFPVIVGNSGSVTPSVSMSLSADGDKAFRLTDATAGVTLRAGDPTLKDIAYGSTTQIASRAILTLDVAGAGTAERDRFVSAITAAATANKWLPAAPGTTPKVQTTITGDSLTLEINTDVAMEMPTPQYGKNAVVWGMFLLSKGLGELGATAADMQLKKAADGITDLFFRDGVEGEAYIGKYMGIPASLLRNPSDGTPNLTFALMGGINSETPKSFYTDASGSLSIPLYVRSMHVTAADASEATAAVTAAFQAKGFTIGNLGSPLGAGLYVTHDNPLTALQFGSYRASIDHDPAQFADPYSLRDVTYPQGTTGGTLASSFRNKMTAFGAVIPGNERWWHTANERMKVDSAVQMTKMMADGMAEMARYSGPAGAKFMWASIPGLNADRADLDLLDVTIGTFKDASAAVSPSQLGTETLLGATSFNIPMWNGRGNSTPTASAFALGHAPGGVYLPLTDPEYLSSTYVAPMRLEFKVQRPDSMSDAAWAKFVAGGYGDAKFNLLVGGAAVPLAVPAGQRADQYFSSRMSANRPDTIYLSVNLAITDAPYTGVQTVLADSKTDLYTVNPTYLASHPDPFPGRGAVERRGFFVFGDGQKNAEFSSPDAVYVTVAKSVVDAPSTVGGSVPATLALTLGGPASFGPFTPGASRDYLATTTATVTSTAGDATLTVADPSDTATGHLVNGAFSLPQPLLALGATGTYAPVGGSSAPTPLKVWDGPAANDSSTVSFKQTIGDGDALRTGAYAKTLTFTLSTTNP
ncbi:MAG TPA: M20/M25/M40 family metallo-hydrolase [Solirubrobacter sp.]|nr:M20/M25/M40 family metallo-hydrolase [Solirubrobacter sp.]